MRRLVLPCLLLLLAAAPVRADEGMWPFDHVPTAALNRKYGAAIDAAWLRHLQLSTVRLANGCTGSFVSPDGLVLTNHHCVQEVVVEHSTPQRDLLAQGYLAATRAEELPASTIEVEVLVAMDDVTPRVAAALAGLDERKANEARKRVLSELELAAEAAARADSTTGPLLCEAVTLYQGGQYLIYKYKRYTDVRLVFAPEYAISDFGGDPDNFQFPRWCFDLGLLRVYENGQPAHTPNFLRIDVAGAREGEPVFIAGHPGDTERLLTLDQLRFNRNAILPLRVLLGSELRGRLIQFGKSGEEANRQVQDPLLNLENSIKGQRKELDALHDDALFASKARAERELRARVAASPKLRAAAGDAWNEVSHAQAKAREQYLPYQLLEQKRAMRSDLYAWAVRLVRGTAEREKPNGDRLREYSESALPYVAQELLAPTPVYPAVERLQLSFGLERVREWLGPDDPLVHLVLGVDSPDTVAARLVNGTRLADPAYRKQLWDGGTAAVQTSTDPMIAFARRLDPDTRKLRKRWEDEVEAPTTQGAERIARARFAVYGKALYPDATFTLRLNDGRVAGWTVAGRTVTPFTTLGQAFARATGQDPLVLPGAWTAARPALDPATPFNLSTTNDEVGGNSGSPIVNARGDLVGLLFDGNFESIAGTYWFDPSVNRAIAVHPAIIQAAFTKIYKADALAKELGLAK